jgi:hypothetical protein
MSFLYLKKKLLFYHFNWFGYFFLDFCLEPVHKKKQPNCNKVYIGETSQHLKECVDQHKNDVSSRHRNISKTALIGHVLQLHHESRNNGNPTSFDGTKILAQESNTQRRKLAEAAQ